MATLVTKTVKSSGGDYTSRSAYEAAQQGDLVAADEVRRAELYAFSDTTAVTVDGSTTDSTRYMEFVAASSDIHDGKWNTGKARLEVTTGFAYPYQLNDDYARVIGDQIYRNSSSGTRSVGYMTAVGTRFERCVVKATGSTTTDAGIQLSGDHANIKVSNNVIYDVGSGGAGILLGFSSNPRLYNNTVKDCAYGFRSTQARTYYLKNNLADNCSSGGFVATAGTLDVNYCASSDATADDFGGTGNRVSQTFTFVDAANDDFHLASGDAGAKDFGTDLSADADYAISIDIDGSTRSGSWDIGADEVVSSGVSGTIAVTLANFTSAVSGSRTHYGTIAQTLANFTSAVSGKIEHKGTIAVTLANFASAVAGSKSHVGTIAVTLDNFVSAMSGTASGVAAAGRWLLRQIGNKVKFACHYLALAARRNRNNG